VRQVGQLPRISVFDVQPPKYSSKENVNIRAIS